MPQKLSQKSGAARPWLAHALAAFRRTPLPAPLKGSTPPMSRAEACLLLNELRGLEQHQRATAPEADSASLRAALYS